MAEWDFFAALREDKPLEAVRSVLQRFPQLVAAVTGTDKKTYLWPARFLFEENGALWFAAAKCTLYYGQLSMTPVLKLGLITQETGSFFRLSGKVLFSEEKDLIDRCLQADPSLQAAYGPDPGMFIAYTLSGIEADLLPSRPEIPARSWKIGDAAGLPPVITFRKKTELRDRLVKILERREAEGPKLTADGNILSGSVPLPEAEEEREKALFAQKLFDGALMAFAESAKTVWSRLSIQPIERSALFQTYNEREQFTALARRLLGNVTVDKPEDLSYYLNKETLLTRAEEKA